MLTRPSGVTVTALRGPSAAPAPRRAQAPPPAPAPSSSPAPAVARDSALDVIRGIALVVLVINHVHLESPLEAGTRAVLSAAEVLVMVSGVVTGLVFGRRWRRDGARPVTAMLLRRARRLHATSVVVVGLAGAATLVPGLATERLRFSPRAPERDLYGFDGPLDWVVGVVTLEAGPWQFNILGFFIAAMALAPVVLLALSRGHWAWVLAASAGLHLLGRATGADVLPSQSERPFGLLVWQVLFVPAIVLGWHRDRVAALVAAHRRTVVAAVLGLAGVAVALRLHALAGGPLFDAAAWDAAHFHKGTLDPARIATMAAVTAALHLALTRWPSPALERTFSPLGTSSFYVFILHVPLCLLVASLPGLRGDGIGPVGNAVVQLALVAGLWAMARHRVLFRWIPR